MVVAGSPAAMVERPDCWVTVVPVAPVSPVSIVVWVVLVVAVVCCGAMAVRVVSGRG
jgi:hypothetical protein